MVTALACSLCWVVVQVVLLVPRGKSLSCIRPTLSLRLVLRLVVGKTLCLSPSPVPATDLAHCHTFFHLCFFQLHPSLRTDQFFVFCRVCMTFESHVTIVPPLSKLLQCLPRSTDCLPAMSFLRIISPFALAEPFLSWPFVPDATTNEITCLQVRMLEAKRLTLLCGHGVRNDGLRMVIDESLTET